MNAVIQFDFFEPIPTEIEMLRLDIAAIGKSSEKVRKALFARNGELTKRMLELEYRLQVLEQNICHSHQNQSV